MCGFTGYINNYKKDKNVIINMNNRIKHRGPDSESYYCDKKINIGFRRLSIIDLDTGNQPIYNEDGTLVLFFNGEIYNYKELREILKQKHHVFQTNTDSEVIIHGYEEYKEDILNKLRGMFSIVIWDIKNKELFLARDTFGIKPLYYGMFDKTFMFSSEIKTFLENPYFKKELNKEALIPYLIFQYNPLDETMFKGVYSLRPSSYLKYKDGLIIIKKYNTYSFNPQKEDKKFKIRQLERYIKNSIKYHNISDVETCSFLSSGIDSSFITSILRPKETFTVGFDIDGFNEINDAKYLSHFLKIKNNSKIITKEEFFKNLGTIEYYMDEPSSNLSAVALYFLARFSSNKYKVALSGEGADELFGGYYDYQESKLLLLYRKLPLILRKKIYSLVENKNYFKGKNFLRKGSLEIKDYYIGQARIFEDDEVNEYLSDNYKRKFTSSSITKKYFDEVSFQDDTTQKQYVDLNLWLPKDILLKADKMTMASSLELRVPFLDKEVFSCAKTLSKKNKNNKSMLRLSSKNYLPDIVLKRKKKGFLVPFKYYLKEEKYYNLIKEEFKSDYASVFFNQEKIINLLDMHYKGIKETHRKIYTIYIFLLWYKQYFINN